MRDPRTWIGCLVLAVVAACAVTHATTTVPLLSQEPNTSQAPFAIPSDASCAGCSGGASALAAAGFGGDIEATHRNPRRGATRRRPT